MMSAVTIRSGPNATAARLLLALLLAIAPMLTFAGGVSPVTASADDVTAVDHQMPCHTGGGTTADPGRGSTACPHCNGGDPLSQCECCTFAAPTGLISLDLGPTQPPLTDIPARLPFSDPLPESPGDRLFRPPIFPS